MTNYEKIKSMSIDEMAEYLAHLNFSSSEWIITQLRNQGFKGEIKLDNKFSEVTFNAKQWLQDESEPTYCTDKQNKLVHCEDCHTGDCESKELRE